MADKLTAQTGLAREQREMRATYASYVSWANTRDPSARTAPAREKFLERFERQVDPNNELPEAERTRRAEHARRAYFVGLALKSSIARSRRKRGAA